MNDFEGIENLSDDDLKILYEDVIEESTILEGAAKLYVFVDCNGKTSPIYNATSWYRLWDNRTVPDTCGSSRQYTKGFCDTGWSWCGNTGDNTKLGYTCVLECENI